MTNSAIQILLLLHYKNAAIRSREFLGKSESYCSWFTHFLDSLAKVGKIAEMKLPPESGGWCMIPLVGAMHQSMRFWQNHGEFGLSLRRYHLNCAFFALYSSFYTRKNHRKKARLEAGTGCHFYAYFADTQAGCARIGA